MKSPKKLSLADLYKCFMNPDFPTKYRDIYYKEYQTRYEDKKIEMSKGYEDRANRMYKKLQRRNKK